MKANQVKCLVAMMMLAMSLGACSKVNKMTEPTATDVQAVTDSSVSGVQKPGAGNFGGTVANQQWWRSLTQAQRNEAICQEANTEMVALGGGLNKLSRPSGYNCKTWAQHVVLVASRNVASLPASTSWSRWAAGQYVNIPGYGPAGMPINGAQRGQIVQASWGSWPHTMIIWSNDGNGVYVIDCNMDFLGGLEIHYVTYAKFESTSGGSYTIYQVIGG